MQSSAPKRDASDRLQASCAPDFSYLDSANDRLKEAVAFSLNRWNGKLPQSREEFIESVAQHVANAIEDTHPESFGEVLRGIIELSNAAERAEAVVGVIAEILDHRNPCLTADAIAFASGMHAIQGGVSEIELAEKHGTTKQAVSKRVTEVSEALNLGVSRGMKSEGAQESYKERAHRIHGTEPKQMDGPMSATRSATAAICRIVRWHERRGDLSDLTDMQREVLKRSFARLKPAFDAVALL